MGVSLKRRKQMKRGSYSTFCCSHPRGQLCFEQGGKYGQACANHDTYRAKTDATNWC